MGLPARKRKSGVIEAMREIYRYEGRGRVHRRDEASFHIECDEGRVLTITEAFGNAEFIVGYCRAAIVDAWGVCCIEPFRRVSDPGFTRSWAGRERTGLILFRRVRLHLAVEESWMRRSD